jgi:hypothetical protein
MTMASSRERNASVVSAVVDDATPNYWTATVAASRNDAGIRMDVPTVLESASSSSSLIRCTALLWSLTRRRYH